MSDVFENDMNYRSRLKAGLAKVEGHLRMAEELLKAPDPEERLALTKTTANATPPEKPKMIGPVPRPTGVGPPETPFPA